MPPRRKRCDDGPLARVKAALSSFELPQVSVMAWDVLQEANSSFTLELDISVDHLTNEACHELTKALNVIEENRDVDSGICQSFFEWLALSADSDSQDLCSHPHGIPSLSRARALIAILGQALGTALTSSSLLAVSAGRAYVALLKLEGAAQFWGTLFQPVLFYQVLRVVATPLCSESSGRHCSHMPSNLEGHETEEVVGEVLDDAAVDEAHSLLDTLVDFLRRPGSSTHALFGKSPEAAAMVAARLGSLLLHPVSEAVAVSAANGLAGFATTGRLPSNAREIRCRITAALRAALPAIMMAQDAGKLNSTNIPPKFAQTVRLIALELVEGIIKSQPEILTVGRRHVRPDTDDATEAAELGKDDPVLSALQIMCVHSPERAEWRCAAAESFIAVTIVAAAAERQAVPAGGSQKQVTGFVKRALAFLKCLLVSERASCRSVAAEAAAAALQRSDELVGTGAVRAQFDSELLVTLVGRCRDMAPTVRGRALSCVGTCILSLSEYEEGRELLQTLALGEAPVVDITSLFRLASLDEKALVRRAGLGFFESSVQVLRSLELGSDKIIDFVDLNLLANLANDESMLVRKAAISSMSVFLRECPQEPVATVWVAHVLPSALDPEAGVVEKAIAEIDAVVLTPISKGSVSAELPLVLRALQKDSEAVEYLKRVLGFLARRPQGTSPQALAGSLMKLAQDCLQRPVSAWPVVVWSMLEELAIQKATPLCSGEVVLDACDLVLPEDGDIGSQWPALVSKILRVFTHVAPTVPRARALKLRDRLKRKLERLAVSPEVVQAVIGALIELEKVLAEPRSTSVGSWRNELARSLDDRIINFTGETRSQMVDHEEDLCRSLLTLGELALRDKVAAAAVSGGAVAAIQAIASNTLQDAGSTVEISATIRSHAFAALGKLCLQQEELAKKSVELFVLHLSDRESFAVRNNVLIILRDLCERYTALVDRFVACMADLLRDPSELLRKQSVMVLSSLLSESYIKFRGSIVHRFLFVLSDPAASVRKLAESVVVRILHPRNPALFPQIFLDVVCGMNGWAGHPGCQSAVGNKEFSLQNYPHRRTVIYRFMLSLMTNEQKFSVCSQMVTSFLTRFVDVEERIELPRCTSGPCGQALHDVLALLVCKEMRICFSPKQASQDEDADLAGSTALAGDDAARTALVSMFKRVMCEHVVPVLVQLKNLMELQHSVFLGNLRRCLCEILREFKDELQDILANDRQLAGEIAFDLSTSTGSEAVIGGGTQEDIAMASTASTLDGQNPSLSTRGFTKAAVTAVRRAGGKRRPLSKVMGDNIPLADAPPEDPAAEADMDAHENLGPLAIGKKVARKNAAQATEAELRESTRRRDEPTADPPAKRLRRVSSEDPQSPVGKRVADVETPTRPIATPGRSAGVLGLIMQHRANRAMESPAPPRTPYSR